jgi:hypothetical protein
MTPLPVASCDGFFEGAAAPGAPGDEGLVPGHPQLERREVGLGRGDLASDASTGIAISGRDRRELKQWSVASHRGAGC